MIPDELKNTMIQNPTATEPNPMDDARKARLAARNAEIAQREAELARQQAELEAARQAALDDKPKTAAECMADARNAIADMLAHEVAAGPADGPRHKAWMSLAELFDAMLAGR